MNEMEMRLKERRVVQDKGEGGNETSLDDEVEGEGGQGDDAALCTAGDKAARELM